MGKSIYIVCVCKLRLLFLGILVVSCFSYGLSRQIESLKEPESDPQSNNATVDFGVIEATISTEDDSQSQSDDQDHDQSVEEQSESDDELMKEIDESYAEHDQDDEDLDDDDEVDDVEASEAEEMGSDYDPRYNYVPDM